MEVFNFTKMLAGATVGLQPDGREVAVIVIKGTFSIPVADASPALTDDQAPLVEADQFTGEPGKSATLYETDFAPIKPRCDVLVNGSAYAPNGQPVQKLAIAVRVAGMAKTFHVVGNRVWTRGMASLTPSEPEFFVKLPVSYDYAFGGVDEADPDKPRYFLANHAGRGYFHHLDLDRLVGQPLPNTEEIDNPISNPRGNYRPMALGPLGRAWQPRAAFAGTYDQKWQEEVFPFLPDDFREDYYQAAPPDQQVTYLKGDEEVSLLNLTPTGRCDFRIPKVEIPIAVRLIDSEPEDVLQLSPALDTLLIEPDLGRFTLTWRIALPLRKNVLEIDHIMIGHPSRSQQIAYESGKPFYRSLAELAMQDDEDGD